MAQLALGYGVSYCVFTVIVRTSDVGAMALPALLPGFALGFVPVALGVILCLQQHRGRSITVEDISLSDALSGIATAAIAMTTVVALASPSVSVVLALVLMRGGVLFLAPLVDLHHGRQVQPVSWLALGLSVMAVLIGVIAQPGMGLDHTLLLVLMVYLAAYAVRLSLMIRHAKRHERGTRADWFQRELIVSTTFLGVVGAVIWVVSARELPPLSSVSTGAAYGLVLAFGSLIYLDPRETTFAVPINRAASLCAGIVAAGVLALLTGASLPPWADVLAASLVAGALVMLLRHDLTERAINP